MQVYVILQRDRPCQEDACRNHQSSPTLLVQRADGLGKSRRVHRHAVTHTAEIGQHDAVLRNYGSHGLVHGNGQALIEFSVIAC